MAQLIEESVNKKHGLSHKQIITIKSSLSKQTFPINANLNQSSTHIQFNYLTGLTSFENKNHYQLQIKMLIQQNFLNIRSTVLYKYFPVVFRDQYIRNILYRTIVFKTNSITSYWIKCLITQQGTFVVKFSLNYPSLFLLLSQNHQQIYDMVQDHYKYFLVINKKITNNLDHILKNTSIKKSNFYAKKQYQQHFELIKKMTNISNREQSFLHHRFVNQSNFKNSKNNLFLKEIYLYDQSMYFNNQHYKQTYLNLKQIKHYFLTGQEPIKISEEFYTPSKIKQIIQSALKFPQLKNNNRFDNEFIISQIYIIQPQSIKWTTFYQGGYGLLKKGKVKFFALEPSDSIRCANTEQIRFRDIQKRNKIEILQKIMVLKTQKTQNHSYNHLEWQIAILKTILKNKKCGFLPRYFYTKQKIGVNQNFLLLQYCKGRSLESWISSASNQTTSIFTKLTLLFYIAYGLSFLHQNQIIHMDLKPANILLERRLLTKIMDFGQSYNQRVQNQMKSSNIKYSPGFTLPYAPPQIFLKKSRISHKCDIFSFGIIMHQILYNYSIFGSNCNHSNLKLIYERTMQKLNIVQAFRSHNFNHIAEKIFFCPQKSGGYLLQELSNCLDNIILRCLHPIQQNRPCIEWIIILLKQINRFVYQYYSF